MVKFTHPTTRKSKTPRHNNPDENLLNHSQNQADAGSALDTRTLISQIQQSPQKMTPASMAQLQRTLGNRAIQRWPGVDSSSEEESKTTTTTPPLRKPRFAVTMGNRQAPAGGQTATTTSTTTATTTSTAAPLPAVPPLPTVPLTTAAPPVRKSRFAGVTLGNRPAPAQASTTATTTSTTDASAPQGRVRKGSDPAEFAPRTPTQTTTPPSRRGGLTRRAAFVTPVQTPDRPSQLPGTLPSSVQFEQAVLAAAETRSDADPAELAAARQALLKKVLLFYQDYEADTKLANAVILHDRLEQFLQMTRNEIELWEAGLHTDGVASVFQSIIRIIDMKVRAETAAQGGSVQEAGAQEAKTLEFFEYVGVPAAYYSKLSPEHVLKYKALYNALWSMEPSAIAAAIAVLEAANIKGFSLVKGLFLTAFPEAANIAHFYNPDYDADEATKKLGFRTEIKSRKSGFIKYTKEEKDKEGYAKSYDIKANAAKNMFAEEHLNLLSPSEQSVLESYMGGGYEEINPALRAKKLEQRADSKDLEARKLAKADVLASALNKLPQYNGKAYRMMNAFEGFDDVVHPGGMYSDLAFLSASKTMQGAEDGGLSGGLTSKGALNVYMIIHTSAAADVGPMSKLKYETEVLFKPGARFKVDAIWSYVDGKIPANAPQEAKIILQRNGESKSRTLGGAKYEGKVRVIELTQT